MALADGAAAVTEVQALLLQTDPDAFTPVTVEGQVFNNLPGSATRLSDAGDPNGLPSTVPPGKSGLCVEVTCREGDERWQAPERLTDRIVADLFAGSMAKNIGSSCPPDDVMQAK